MNPCLWGAQVLKSKVSRLEIRGIPHCPKYNLPRAHTTKLLLSASEGKWDNGVKPLAFKELNNDPSAGSPTETLLRLLLPLNDQV